MKKILDFTAKIRLILLSQREYLRIVIPYVKNFDLWGLSNLLNELDIKHQIKILGRNDLDKIPRFSVLQCRILLGYRYVF